MKSNTLITFLFLFGLFNSCNKKVKSTSSEFIESKLFEQVKSIKKDTLELPKNTNFKFVENRLFGKVKSVQTKTFENDTLKSVKSEFYTIDGIIEKSKYSFEPNLSFGERLYKYNNRNKLKKEIIISDGDTTNTYLYKYNNLGLIRKEQYYENKLQCITNFKIDSSKKIIEKNFKYLNSDGLRTFKYYYPDSLTTIIKEFLRGYPDMTTEIKIYHKENKKEILKRNIFPQYEFGEVFYHNIQGNIIKKERFYDGKITEIENFTYELDFEKNWIKSESGIIRKEREIEYHKK